MGVERVLVSEDMSLPLTSETAICVTSGESFHFRGLQRDWTSCPLRSFLALDVILNH